jgi:FkbM family methyltransferase
VNDIGANMGCFAVYAGRGASKGRVLAFEPDADNVDLARRNAAINGLSNVTVERCAVSGEPGTLKLFRGAHGPLHTTMAGRLEGADEADEVPAITLKQIMDKYKVDRCGFLKMNCEGAEYGILYKTPPEYLQRVDRVALEYHAAPHENKDQISRELAAYLAAQGFDIFDFSDFVGFDCGFIRGTRRR